MAAGSPLMSKPKGSVLTSMTADAHAAYNIGPHATFTNLKDCPNDDMQFVTDYEPMKLSSFRVFCAVKGTVLQDPVLFIEQALVTLIFFGAALPVYILFKEDVAADRKGAMNVRDWLDAQDEKMRAFAKIMTGLAAFLLSFYTSTSVGRWWTVRTQGIGGIKAATMDLTMFISQFVTREDKVLKAIRRYSRASLTMVFLWRRHKMDFETLKSQLLNRGILEEEDIKKLWTWNHCLHETIWSWQAGIVTMLYKEGRIKSDQLLALLLQRVADGRQAVQLIHTHVAVRIPMQYVHLLGLLVKMHNFVLALIMGILFGAALRELEHVVCFQLFGRTLILPFLFNAILLINAELADPFEGAASDFPNTPYEKALEKDGEAFVLASANLPNWIASKYQPPP